MTKLLSKKFSTILSGALACFTPMVFTGLTSCGNSHAIQLANFESYMNGDLMDYLADKYGVQYQWFTVTEMIETKFQKVYDIAVPSGYELISLYQKDWLEPIDWAKFNVRDMEGNEIKDENDAMNLFAQPIQDAIAQMNISFQEYLEQPNFNILKYGVPYFAQSFMFVYKGDEIKFYKNGTTTEASQPTWADIFYTISPNNPRLDSRFRERRIGMVDDAKSIYDVSRIIQTTEQNPDQRDEWTNKMPTNASINDLVDTFKALTSKAKSNWYTLNTDSGVISRNLADHQKNSYVAALSWSGDALYSSLGAEEFDPYTGEQMHIQRPYGASLDEIEFLVMNKKNEGTERMDRVYNIVKDICLDGCDSSIEEIAAKTSDDKYKHWAMQNWDTVNYTPILKSIYDYVTAKDSSYWDQYDADESSRILYTSILKMTNQEYATSRFGRTLTDLENSNTHWAWLQSRGNL